MQPAGQTLRFYRPFMPMFGGIFCCLLTVGASLATVPFYVLHKLHGGNVEVGVAVAALSVAAVISRPVAGRLADRHGYKVVMLTGTVICACAGLAYYGAHNIALLVAIRILNGTGEGTVYTGGAAWLVSLCPAERRGRIVGLYGIFMWLGITLGTLAGTVAMHLAGFPAVWGFCAVAGTVGLLSVSVKRAPPRPEVQRRRSHPGHLGVAGGARLRGAGRLRLAAHAGPRRGQRDRRLRRVRLHLHRGPAVHRQRPRPARPTAGSILVLDRRGGRPGDRRAGNEPVHGDHRRARDRGRPVAAVPLARAHRHQPHSRLAARSRARGVHVILGRRDSGRRPGRRSDRQPDQLHRHLLRDGRLRDRGGGARLAPVTAGPGRLRRAAGGPGDQGGDSCRLRRSRRTRLLTPGEVPGFPCPNRAELESAEPESAELESGGA